MTARVSAERLAQMLSKAAALAHVYASLEGPGGRSEESFNLMLDLRDAREEAARLRSALERLLKSHEGLMLEHNRGGNFGHADEAHALSWTAEFMATDATVLAAKAALEAKP